MSRGREGKGRSPSGPRIRRAPLLELLIFEVSEGELDQLARGAPDSLLLNLGLTLLSMGLTLVVTLVTTSIASTRVFLVFVVVCVLALMLGVILLAYWWRTHTSTRDLVERIKRRMPPPSVQDSTAMPGDEP